MRLLIGLRAVESLPDDHRCDDRDRDVATFESALPSLAEGEGIRAGVRACRKGAEEARWCGGAPSRRPHTPLSVGVVFAVQASHLRRCGLYGDRGSHLRRNVAGEAEV